MPEMSRKDVVLITTGVLVLAVAGILAWRNAGPGGGRNPDFPEGHLYVCGDCGHEMTLSDRELFDLKAEARKSSDLDAGRVKCDGCGSANTLPAVKCPRCGRFFPEPGGRPRCPHCGEAFPSPFEGD